MFFSQRGEFVTLVALLSVGIVTLVSLVGGKALSQGNLSTGSNAQASCFFHSREFVKDTSGNPLPPDVARSFTNSNSEGYNAAMPDSGELDYKTDSLEAGRRGKFVNIYMKAPAGWQIVKSSATGNGYGTFNGDTYTDALNCGDDYTYGWYVEKRVASSGSGTNSDLIRRYNLKVDGDVIGDYKKVPEGVYDPAVAQKLIDQEYPGRGFKAQIITVKDGIRTEGNGYIAAGNTAFAAVDPTTNTIENVYQHECWNSGAPLIEVQVSCYNVKVRIEADKGSGILDFGTVVTKRNGQSLVPVSGSPFLVYADMHLKDVKEFNFPLSQPLEGEGNIWIDWNNPTWGKHWNERNWYTGTCPISTPTPIPTKPLTVQLDWFLIPRDSSNSCPWGDPTRPSTTLACYLSWSTANICSGKTNNYKPESPAVGPNNLAWSCSGGVEVQNLNSHLTISNPANSGKTITAYCGAHTCDSCQMGGDGNGNLPYCSQCVGGSKRLTQNDYVLPPGCSATCTDNGTTGQPTVTLSGSCTNTPTPTPTAKPNVPPSCRALEINPSNGILNPGGNISLVAYPTDADGVIRKVDFYYGFKSDVDATPAGSPTPWRFLGAGQYASGSWIFSGSVPASIKPGAYYFVANVYDDKGAFCSGNPKSAPYPQCDACRKVVTIVAPTSTPRPTTPPGVPTNTPIPPTATPRQSGQTIQLDWRVDGSTVCYSAWNLSCGGGPNNGGSGAGISCSPSTGSITIKNNRSGTVHAECQKNVCEPCNANNPISCNNRQGSGGVDIPTGCSATCNEFGTPTVSCPNGGGGTPAPSRCDWCTNRGQCEASGGNPVEEAFPNQCITDGDLCCNGARGSTSGMSKPNPVAIQVVSPARFNIDLDANDAAKNKTIDIVDFLKARTNYGETVKNALGEEVTINAQFISGLIIRLGTSY